MSGRRAALGWTMLGIAVLVLPWLVPQRYFLRVAALALIYGTLALGLQLLVGWAGQLSIGHAAFYGTGAYTSAILTTKFGVPVEAAFLGGGLVSSLLALTLMPITRLRGNELAVATLGFGVIIHAVILNEEWLTEGPFGMMRIPPLRMGPLVDGHRVSLLLRGPGRDRPHLLRLSPAHPLALRPRAGGHPPERGGRPNLWHQSRSSTRARSS